MVFNEREAIRFRMEKISEEKKVLYQRDRDLDKEYNFYIQRLRELDHNGLGSATSLKHDQSVDHSFKEPKTEELPKKQEKKYSGDLKQYDFDALKQGLSHFKKQRKSEQPVKQMETKFQLDPNDRRRRGKQYDLQEVAEVTEKILKEYGEPMEIHKLRDCLIEKGYKWKHFLPTLPNIMKHSERIEKPYRGHVLFVKDGSNGEATDQAKAASDEVASGVEDADEANVKMAAGEIPDSAVSNQNNE